MLNRPFRHRDAPPQGPVALRIHEIVRQKPGIHFRELGREATLTSTGQLRHHLDRLARRGLVSEVADGRYRRYFPAAHAVDLQPQLARLSRPLPRRIARLLLAGPLGRTALRRQLGCADSTLGYHLNRMLRHGDLVQQRERRGNSYVLADPERIRRVLLAQDGAAAERIVPSQADIAPLVLPAVPASAEPLSVASP